MDIQLLRKEMWDLIDRFNLIALLCLSQVRIRISNVIFETVDHHCFNILTTSGTYPGVVICDTDIP